MGCTATASVVQGSPQVKAGRCPQGRILRITVIQRTPLVRDNTFESGTVSPRTAAASPRRLVQQSTARIAIIRRSAFEHEPPNLPLRFLLDAIDVESEVHTISCHATRMPA